MVFIIMKTKERRFPYEIKSIFNCRFNCHIPVIGISHNDSICRKFSIPTFNASINAENVSPRYRFIQSATIAVHPNKSETVYTLDISGIETVTSVSGTATLYKKNSSGNYVKIDSEELSFRGSSVSYKGDLTSSGSGSYKIEFVGTVYTATGSESITISNTSSY